MKNFVALVIAWIFSFPALAQDTDIRVLGLYLSPIEDFNDAKQALATIPSAWNNTSVGGLTPTSITLVNGGNPLPLYSVPSGLSANATIQNLYISGELNQARMFHAADVVVVFVGPIMALGFMGVCGIAPNPNWISDLGLGTFIPTSSGLLDLRGASNAYIAAVSTDSASCDNRADVAAHEFGHLLGAGHYKDDRSDGHSWLFTDSHASFRVIYDPVFGIFPATINFTVMGNIGLSDDCNAATTGWSNLPCQVDVRYSTGASPFGSSTRNNRGALRATGRSVANYLTGVGSGNGGATQCADGVDNDSDGQTDINDADCPNQADNQESGTSGPATPAPNPLCTNAPPTAVVSALVGVCFPFLPWTQYFIDWQPGGTCPVLFYEMYAAQPPGTPYRLVGPVSAINGSHSNVLVQGGNSANIRIRSCYPQGCTTLSTSSTTIVPLC